MIFIFDIDGTLANLNHRLHFIQDGKQDWDSFFEACDKDVPIYPVLTTCQLLYDAGATILLVSGRSDAVRDKTVAWLNRCGVYFHGLYMRKAGDHRQDDIVKAELFEKLASEWDAGVIVAIFEDRDQVVEMFRKKGLQVFQVAEGNF